MKKYSRWAKKYPALSDHIALNIDGLASANAEYWLVWKDAVLDITGDTNDQGKLRAIIRKMTMSLRSSSLQGARAVECLASMARLMPTVISGGKHGVLFSYLDSCFPFWKSPAMTEQLSAYVENLLSLALVLDFPAAENIFELIINRAVEMDLALHSDEANIPASASSTVASANKVIAFRSTEALYAGTFDEFDQPSQQSSLPESLDLIDGCKEKLLNLLKTFLKFLMVNDDRIHMFGLSLIRIFDRTILPALYCSRVTTLLAFAACKDVSVADRFLGYLLAALYKRDSHVGASIEGRLPCNGHAPATLMAISSHVRSFSIHLTCVSDALIQSSAELLLIFCSRKVELMSTGRQSRSPSPTSNTSRKASWLNESAADRSIVVSSFCAFLHLAVTHSEALRSLIMEQSTQASIQQIIQSPFMFIDSCPEGLWAHFVKLFNYESTYTSLLSAFEPNHQQQFRSASPLLSLYLSEGFEMADPFMPISELAQFLPSSIYRLSACNK